MDRRGFLYAVAAAGLNACFPQGMAPGTLPELDDNTRIADVVEKEAPFNPAGEYGRCIDLHGPWEKAEMLEERTIAVLITDARGTLPSGTPFEIRHMRGMNYGQRHGWAWYYRGDMVGAPKRELGFVGKGGYYLLGQHVA